jgi:hypothetical protein
LQSAHFLLSSLLGPAAKCALCVLPALRTQTTIGELQQQRKGIGRDGEYQLCAVRARNHSDKKINHHVPLSPFILGSLLIYFRVA